MGHELEVNEWDKPSRRVIEDDTNGIFEMGVKELKREVGEYYVRIDKVREEIRCITHL